VRALYAQRTLSDELYDATVAAFGVQGVIELTVLAGYYGMLGFVLNTMRVDAPAGSEIPFAVGQA
jgi:4-carboxymuconolactone decarboxylase